MVLNPFGAGILIFPVWVYQLTKDGLLRRPVSFGDMALWLSTPRKASSNRIARGEVLGLCSACVGSIYSLALSQSIRKKENA